MKKTISIRSIKAWITREFDQPETDVVGMPNSGCECLVANYIRDALGYSGVFVAKGGQAEFNWNKRQLSPAVTQLIEVFDEFPRNHPVTARQAIDLIERMEQPA